MRVLYKEDNDSLVISLCGELDHHFASEIKSKIDKKLKSGSVKSVVLDMKGVDFIDSSAIGFIIGRYKVARQNNSSLKIINASPKIKRILDMSGIGKIIKIS